MPPSSAPEEVISTSVGPGALPRGHEEQPSLLDGVTEYEWIDLLNPLSVAFVAQVASSRPVNAPVKVYQTPGLQSGIRNESDLATQYGLTGFKNPDHPSNVHVPHTIELAAGATRRFPGNEAQVVLRQLVGYMLQVEGKGLKLADPYERHQMEQRLIRGRGSVQDLMDAAPTTVQAQMKAAIDRSNNPEPSYASAPTTTEIEFPDARGVETAPSQNGAGAGTTTAPPNGDSVGPKV